VASKIGSLVFAGLSVGLTRVVGFFLSIGLVASDDWFYGRFRTFWTRFQPCCTAAQCGRVYPKRSLFMSAARTKLTSIDPTQYSDK
jgi:hypothetical protein